MNADLVTVVVERFNDSQVPPAFRDEARAVMAAFLTG